MVNKPSIVDEDEIQIVIRSGDGIEDIDGEQVHIIVLKAHARLQIPTSIN